VICMGHLVLLGQCKCEATIGWECDKTRNTYGILVGKPFGPRRK
jgi:hypothetical protein